MRGLQTKKRKALVFRVSKAVISAAKIIAKQATPRISNIKSVLSNLEQRVPVHWQATAGRKSGTN
jgi:hypothetical protein